MSISTSHAINMVIEEVINDDAKTRISKQPSMSTRNGSSSPAVTKQAGGARQLTAGADTIDLTSFNNISSGSVDFTGLKVQMIYIEITTATNEVTFAEGASNGFPAFAASNGKIGLGQANQVFFVLDETTPDVSASVKTIDVASSDLDAEYEIYMVAG
jgi:hypothetical protein